MEVTDSDKHSRLLHKGITYGCKQLYSTGPKYKTHSQTLELAEIILTLKRVILL